MTKSLYAMIFLVLSISINQNMLSQIRDFPSFTVHNKWFYQHSANFYDTLKFDQQNENWECVQDTLISDTAYKYIEAITYDKNRKEIFKEYFVFTIVGSQLSEKKLGLMFDSAGQEGSGGNIAWHYKNYYGNRFGKYRFLNWTKLDISSFGTGAYESIGHYFTGIAGIGIDSLERHFYRSGQGSTAINYRSFRYLKGALINGELIGDSSFVVKVNESEKLAPISSQIRIKNYPNPFNSSSLITYQIPSNGNVVVQVQNLLGQEIFSELKENQNQGEYVWKFNGAKLSSGVYLISIRVNNYLGTHKIILVK